jgi:predicted AlkP superfamily phosphohydrolase/phosphomutase
MKLMIKISVLMIITMILLCGNIYGAAGVGKKTSTSNQKENKVILVGIDCASWDVIIPLVKEGKLPNFEKIIKGGAVGDLRSIEPMYSPVLWTTIATGMDREKHGITNFLVKSADGKKMLPVTTDLRKTKAFWNIASEKGKKVGLSGWYISWPAEKINGWEATDQTWPTRERKLGLKVALAKSLSDKTYPKSLLSEIDAFHVTPDTLTPEDYDRLGVTISKQPQGLFFAEVDLPDEVKYAYAQDLSWHKTAQYLWDQKHPDILAMYFNGVDVTTHFLWTQYRYYRMRDAGETSPTFPTVITPYAITSSSQTLLTPEDRRAYIQGRILVRYYMFMDKVLGDYIQRMDEKTVLMICSDHGFGESYRTDPIILPDGGYTTPPAWHSLRGVVALYGNSIKKGYTIQKATLRDITPTLLYLSGIPPASDMDGKVIKEAIDSTYLSHHPVRTVKSYEYMPPPKPVEKQGYSKSTAVVAPIPKPKPKPAHKNTAQEDEELIEKLRSIGYIQ